jgi:UDP-N-acetylmuramoylalanine--D-glutamate ligase
MIAVQIELIILALFHIALGIEKQIMTNTSWTKNLSKPIAVIGLGKSGLSALRFLKAIGYEEEDILTFDDKDASAQFKNPEDLVKRQPKTLVVSPGVPLKTLWIQKLLTEGALLTSELSLATSILTTEKLIGITGSVGKSTVTSILGEGAKIMDDACFVGGNLGTPFCEYATRVAKGEKKASWVVLELSSYQLENCEHLSLVGSAVTFLSANHLERYDNLDHYYKTKMKITDITKDFCVFNKNSPDAVQASRFSKCPAVLTSAEDFINQELLSSIVLIGAHNKDNFCVAAEVAHLCEWNQESLKAMAQFRGLRHRMEYVAEVEGVKYVNDSKATAMESVLVAVTGALEAVNAGQKLYLLLGGKDKNLPWEQLGLLKKNQNIRYVFFGACGKLAGEKSGLTGEYFESLGSAVEYCQKQTVRGDVVLLSPGGTSLDEFKSFEERGDFFKRLVLAGAEA